ncbi:MAG: transporter [Rhodospirillaceae bacterium]|nr:transporter [Rhodospirillaceae bacterium]
MITVLLSLVPVMLLIGLGFALRRYGFPGEPFWPATERVIYFILFPALLIDSLSKADLGPLNVLPVAAAMTAGTLFVAGLVVAAKPFLRLDGAAFTSVFQGAVRFNTYVGIAAAFAMFGAVGTTLSAVVMAVLIPLANVLSVLALLRYGPVSATSRRYIVTQLLKNPLILGCVGGLLLNGLGTTLPPGLDDAVHFLGRAALPLGLLAVGAGLEPDGMAADNRAIVATCIFRLILMPLSFLAFCVLFGVEGVTATVAVLFASLPAASTAYILARQMGGDAPLMANIITLSTIVSAVTMPVMIALAR